MTFKDNDVILRIEMRRLPGNQVSFSHHMQPANPQEAEAIHKVLTDMKWQLIELTKQAAINAQKNAGKRFEN
jgi:hypothetical protein